MPEQQICITMEELEDFKKMYEKAGPGEVFIFKGNQFLKEYAKYLIQFLEKEYGDA